MVFGWEKVNSGLRSINHEVFNYVESIYKIFLDFNCIDLVEICNSRWKEIEPIPASAFDLLFRLLSINPFNRITALQGLHHSFLNN